MSATFTIDDDSESNHHHMHQLNDEEAEAEGDRAGGEVGELHDVHTHTEEHAEHLTQRQHQQQHQQHQQQHQQRYNAGPQHHDSVHIEPAAELEDVEYNDHRQHNSNNNGNGNNNRSPLSGISAPTAAASPVSFHTHPPNRHSRNSSRNSSPMPSSSSSSAAAAKSSAPTAASPNSTPSTTSSASVAVSRPRLALYAVLLALGLANLIVGPVSWDSSECTSLSSYAIVIGSLLTLLVAADYATLHLQADKERIERFWQQSPAGRLLRVGIMFVSFVILVLSCVALGWVKQNRCPVSSSVRQLALLDAMLVLCVALSGLIYAAVSCLFPSLRLSKLGRQVGKAALLGMCFAGCVACVANLIASPRNGPMVYHWGYGVRPNACDPTVCGKQQENETARPLLCFDSRGMEVSDAVCDALVPDEKPPKEYILGLPCPIMPCHLDNSDEPNTAYSSSIPQSPIQQRWALQVDAADRQNPSSYWNLPSDPTRDPLFAQCVEPMAMFYHSQVQMTISCWSPTYGFETGHMVQPRSSNGCDNQPKPAAWIWSDMNAAEYGYSSYDFRYSNGRTLTINTTKRPCPQECTRLFVGAIIFAIGFGLTCIGLLLGTFCSRHRRTQKTTSAAAAAAAASLSPSSSASTAANDDPASQSAVQVAEEHAIANVDVVDVAVLPFASPSAASPTLPPSSAAATAAVLFADDSLHSDCRHICLSCTLLLSSLFRIGRRGVRVALPWYMHVLLVISGLTLLAAAVFSIIEMVWLLDGQCTDYTVSAVFSCVVTLSLLCAAIAVIVRQRELLVDLNKNPFEVVGLLQIDSEAEEDDAVDHRSRADREESEVERL